jgi:pimeloyl-ACP methyl ester carboxylesterase
MKKFLLLVLLLIWASVYSIAQKKGEIFEFDFEGVTLNGILNMPEHTPPKGIVLIVHGAGRTNAVEKEWYRDVRQTLLKSGYATYMWDKMGCGKSGGTFNYNQPVENSSMEAIAAIHALRNIPGSDNIGLWGISRAGWINPIVINRYKDIRFWISVSGVDEKENFRYLLEQNLKIDDLPKDSVDLIVNEWMEGTKITHYGGSFEEYRSATSHLSANPFWLRFTNGGITEEGYYSYQQTFRKETLDEASGLQVYIEDFPAILSAIDCPVLALFGEKDMNVNWTQTRQLYKNTLGRKANLTMRSFAGCNHNLMKCTTGGFYELQDANLSSVRCDDFLKAMEDWLNKL